MPTNPKPVLAVVRQPVFRVRHRVLEAYITEVFGFDFDFLVAVLQTEGVCIDYKVTGDLEGENQRRADQLRSGRRTRDVALILNTLAHDKYIASGLYTVTTHPEADPTVIYTELLQALRDPLDARCLQFKNVHKANPVFMKRAELLDKLVIEHVKSTQR